MNAPAEIVAEAGLGLAGNHVPGFDAGSEVQGGPPPMLEPTVTVRSRATSSSSPTSELYNPRYFTYGGTLRSGDDKRCPYG
jgi:hypothetical protein